MRKYLSLVLLVGSFVLAGCSEGHYRPYYGGPYYGGPYYGRYGYPGPYNSRAYRYERDRRREYERQYRHEQRERMRHNRHEARERHRD